MPKNVAAVSPSTKCSRVAVDAAEPKAWLAVIEGNLKKYNSALDTNAGVPI
jgi:hypothetical protein